MYLFEAETAYMKNQLHFQVRKRDVNEKDEENVSISIFILADFNYRLCVVIFGKYRSYACIDDTYLRFPAASAVSCTYYAIYPSIWLTPSTRFSRML